MRDPRQWPAPWLFGLLILPLGIYVGFIWTALPLLLSQAGLTIEQIARINAILQVPPILLFLWTPVVDVKLRRCTWLVLGALATSLLLWIACQFGTSHVRLLTALLFFAGVVVALVMASCGGLMATCYRFPRKPKLRGGIKRETSAEASWALLLCYGWSCAFPCQWRAWPRQLSLPCQLSSHSPLRSRRPLLPLG
jgi:hypothetical protein